MKPIFTAEEVKKLKKELQTTGPDLLLRLLLATGARSKELFFIEPHDYSKQMRVIHLRTAKGGNPRKVPLKPWAAVGMDRLVAETSCLITNSDKPETFTRLLQVYWAKRRFAILGYDPLNRTLHSFRHNVATLWYRRGVPLITIQQLLGHRSIESTMRYLQPSSISEYRGKMI